MCFGEPKHLASRALGLSSFVWELEHFSGQQKGRAFFWDHPLREGRKLKHRVPTTAFWTALGILGLVRAQSRPFDPLLSPSWSILCHGNKFTFHFWVRTGQLSLGSQILVMDV